MTTVYKDYAPLLAVSAQYEYETVYRITPRRGNEQSAQGNALG